MEYEGATEADLKHEITLADMAIRREEGRKTLVSKLLTELKQSGKTRVGERDQPKA